MDVVCSVWIRCELEDQGDDGDGGGAEDGEGVVEVVPGHLRRAEVLDLAEPEPHVHTQARQPEEDGERGELEQEAEHDAAAGVDEDVVEAAAHNNYGEGEGEEEEERNLDCSHVICSQFLDTAVDDDDEDDTDNTDGHDNNLRRLAEVVLLLVMAHPGHSLRGVDAVLVEAVLGPVYHRASRAH